MFSGEAALQSDAATVVIEGDFSDTFAAECGIDTG